MLFNPIARHIRARKPRKSLKSPHLSPGVPQLLRGSIAAWLCQETRH